MKKMNKKAAIEMSINTIVVLVLALAMLGVGISVIGRVEEGTGQFDVTEEVEKQMYDKLKKSGEKLVLETEEIRMKNTDSEESYYAIKNVFTDSKTFKVSISCESSMGNHPLGADQNFGITFGWIDSVTLKPSGQIVHPFTIDPSNAQPDFYSCKVEVIYEEDGEEIDYALEHFNLKIE